MAAGGARLVAVFGGMAALALAFTLGTDDQTAELLACRPWGVHPEPHWGVAALQSLTCGFVHWNAAHLAVNLAACAALAVCAWPLSAQGSGSQTKAMRPGLALLAALPLTHLAIASCAGPLSGTLGDWRYGGLSGWLHAAWAITALLWISASRSNALDDHGHGWPHLGWALLLALGAKLLWEAPWQHPLVVNRGLAATVAVMPWAHVMGAVCGLGVCAVWAIAQAVRRWRRPG